MSTAQIMQQARVNQAAAGGSSTAGLRSKAGSISSRTGTPGGSRFTPPISRHNSHSSAGTSLSPESSAAPRVLAPPPYSAAGGAPLSSPSLSAGSKRAPPPPPPLKPRPSHGPKPVYATALYDFQAQSDGDLSFQTGDRM